MFDHGTLIVLIPTAQGLVAASDSRLSLDAAYCDGVEKFIEPARPDRLLMMVTGRRGIWPMHVSMILNPCEFIKTHEREFDFGHLARDYVERANVPLEHIDADALVQHCLQGIASFLNAHPHRLDGSKSFSRLALASYDPVLQTSRIRIFDFDFQFAPGAQITGRERFNMTLSPENLAAPIVLGESDYFFDHVQPRMLEGSLREATKTALQSPQPIRKATVGEAIQIATDLIEGTYALTSVLPPPSGIGGPIDIRVLGAGARALKQSVPGK